jgi:toxin ParE1/3/4
LRVVRTALAEEDLVEIWLHVAKDDQRAADRLLDELERRTNLLSRHPGMGRERPEIAAGLRYVPAGEYLILYRLTPGHIEIVRYVHGRRDLKRVT